MISLASKLDLELGFRPLPEDPKHEAYLPAEAARVKGEGLPETLPWRSGVTVRKMGKDWRVLYGRGKEAVLVERKYGKGSLVVATDSFFTSNEALRDERQSALLAWLVGPARRVLFDETHLSISEDVGVVDLALRYRLHGVIAVMLALAGLFIWKSASPLVPPVDEDAGARRGRGQDGRDAWAGLVDLLGRNIGKEKILGVCLAEWAKGRAGAPGTKEMEKQMREIAAQEEAQPPARRNPVQAYRAMAEVVKKRGRK